MSSTMKRLNLTLTSLLVFSLAFALEAETRQATDFLTVSANRQVAGLHKEYKQRRKCGSQLFGVVGLTKRF